MSDAKVAFLTMDYQPSPAAEAARFSFECPKGSRCVGLLIAGKCDLKRDGQNKNGGIAQWDWNGNAEAPTFSPSVNCKGCWHGFISNGRCVDPNGNDEPEPEPQT